MKKALLFILIAILLLGGLSIYEAGRFNDGLLHIVFCDVGQGDAILIRTPSRKHVLIDAGPDRKVLNCLAQHMPFWERKIDLVVLTHPHADHFMGMHYLTDRYTVLSFATERLVNTSETFEEVMKKIREKEIPVRYVGKGDRWILPSADLPLSIYHFPFGKSSNGKSMENGKQKMENNIVLSVLGPSDEYLKSTSPNGKIGESKEFASVILSVKYGSFHAIFTGDSQVSGLQDATDNLDYSNNPIDILQIPHHGSKSGLNADIVQKLSPSVAVASVGENRYGHPNKKILQLFAEQKIPVLRTDMRGDIEIVSNEEGWKVR